MSPLARGLATTFLGGLMHMASAQMVIPPGGAMTLNGGAMDMACEPVDIGGTLEGGIENAGDLTIQPGGVWNSMRSAVHLGAGLNNLGTLTTTGSVVVMDGHCAPAGAAIVVSGPLEVSELTLSSTSGQNFVFQPGQPITVTDHLTVQGKPGQPLSLLSANGQPVTIHLGPQAVVNQSDVVLTNVQIGASVTPPIPPATVQPVPAWHPAFGAALSLLMLLSTAAHGLRRRPLNRTSPQP